jgi:hypothetical protein
VLAAGVALFEAVELEFCGLVSYTSVPVCELSLPGSDVCALTEFEGLLCFRVVGRGVCRERDWTGGG